VEDTIQVAPVSMPVLIGPGKQFARIGVPVHFTIGRADSANLPVRLTAGDLPAGAVFDAESGHMEWVPVGFQAGTHEITFTATSLAGESTTAQVAIDVDLGVPVVSSSESLACSPGALATVSGKWLVESAGTFEDASGGSLELGGTRVRMNGHQVAVVFASPTRVKFLCPAMAAGTELSMTVETPAGASEPLSGTMQAAAPRILLLEGWGANQGLIYFADSNERVVDRSPREAGRPAQPGDEVLIWSTGLGQVGAESMAVKVGGLDAGLRSMDPVPGSPGIYALRVRVPGGITPGAPVQLQVTLPGGERLTSNTVTIAIEAASQ
jgi:uncharacterized protein (TIGR03437 family)